MNENFLIKKIRTYSLVSLLIPLLTLNFCYFAYYILGNINIYPNFNWDNKITKVSLDDYMNPTNTLFFCPKYKIANINLELTNGKNLKLYSEVKKDGNRTKEISDKVENDLIKNNQIRNFIFNHSDILNDNCIENRPFISKLISSLNLEKKIIEIKILNKSGFAKIKNPYLNGEVSISRTARYFPANIFFKIFIILSAITLFLYWKNTKNLFQMFKKNNKINEYSKKFFYFGALSAMFLVLHAIFLGWDLYPGNKLYNNFRKLVIIAFIIFEVVAQLLLTINFYKFKKILTKNLSSNVVYIKVYFIFFISIITLVSFYILSVKDPSSNFKHILEWNYFTLLLVYYGLSRFVWKL